MVETSAWAWVVQYLVLLERQGEIAQLARSGPLTAVPGQDHSLINDTHLVGNTYESVSKDGFNRTGPVKFSILPGT